jgi:hypothetical protein
VTTATATATESHFVLLLGDVVALFHSLLMCFIEVWLGFIQTDAKNFAQGKAVRLFQFFQLVTQLEGNPDRNRWVCLLISYP